MSTTKLFRFSLSTPVVAVFWITSFLLAQHVYAADLKVMKVGLGSGTVASGAAINCGVDCDESYLGPDVVTLAAAPTGASAFVGWSGDCSGTALICTVTMSASHSVRAEFGLSTTIPVLSSFTPEGIATYLTANTAVNSAARFIKALPSEYKRNWILMSRSESLQTGTAQSPRFLFPSANAQFVFTVGATTHSSYPGSHPDAIEYMQWDPAQKNFRFHEIVVANIPAMGDTITLPDGSMGSRFSARARGVSIDDVKCSKCHSTRNVLNINRSVSPPVPGVNPGTDGVPPGSVIAKNKPNWDAYDSWGGMLPFNRDRIYQGSVEAAAFRKVFNLWTWRANDSMRSIIEQLELQPPGTNAVDAITRTNGGVNDGHINFAFDVLPPVLTEPVPVGTDPSIVTSYAFNRVAGTGAATAVARGGSFVMLRHTSDVAGTGVAIEGRGVQLFDLLGGLDGTLNQQRIASELVNHRFATGSVPIDIRPIALAITNGCVNSNATTKAIASSSALTVNFGFFDARNGMNFSQLFDDTEKRASVGVSETRSPSLPRRKADVQKLNLDRTGDPYLYAAENGLIQQYGATTSALMDTSLARLRREVFRRPIDLGGSDGSVMGGVLVDRESYGYNTSRVALYRYFLEPLGVSVDKWSMSVRGRSRSYTFADVFSTYANVIQPELRASLFSTPIAGLTNPDDCTQLITAVNSTLASLPDVNQVPTFTDVQRIFNKSCIECHGGLGYPPYGTGSLDFSEDESPPAMVPPLVSPRLARSHATAVAYTTANPATSYLYSRITQTDEACPSGLMPCGGPPLSKVDVETIRRWIVGVPSRPSTAGDPHLKTVDGTHYDFQSAGEFVLLRNESLEIQARQTAIETEGPLGPNGHTGLSSCASLNSAVAVRVGNHRITYQPNLSGRPDPEGLQLRVDGKLLKMGAQGISLATGGRIIRTTAPGGIQIEAPGGTVIVVTPGWWDHYQVWYLNIDAQHARATEGVMGAIAPGNWLPALPDGTLLGPRPRDLHQRYLDLYVKFEDAWRVSDATTLFDYAPGPSTGTSTSAFTNDSWPVENPKNCAVPKQQTGGPVAKPPLKALAVEVAQQHCNAIVDGDRKANCVQDVMVTGEPGFAKTYLLTEKIESNAMPVAPQLGIPANNAALAKPVKFTWQTTTDLDDDTVTYRHCVWIAGDRPTFDNCDSTPIKATSWDRGIVCALLVILIGCVLLGLLIFMGK